MKQWVREVLGVKFLSRLGQLMAFLAHAWKDERVPVVARILLFILPLYLFAPYDLLPDHLPGGFGIFTEGSIEASPARVGCQVRLRR